MLTVEKLRETLIYDPETGVFRWRRSGFGQTAGSVAGTVTPAGYRRIGINKKTYAAHRLAWLYVFGVWPPPLDHRDNDRDNNRLRNLRPATKSQNAANRRVRADSRTGLKGVSWHRATRRWTARIEVDGKRRTIGYFKSAEEAHVAYARAAVAAHGEFARAA